MESRKPGSQQKEHEKLIGVRFRLSKNKKNTFNTKIPSG